MAVERHAQTLHKIKGIHLPNNETRLQALSTSSLHTSLTGFLGNLKNMAIINAPLSSEQHADCIDASLKLEIPCTGYQLKPLLLLNRLTLVRIFFIGDDVLN